jgi:hypothetical protein
MMSPAHHNDVNLISFISASSTPQKRITLANLLLNKGFFTLPGASIRMAWRLRCRGQRWNERQKIEEMKRRTS